MNVTGRRLWPIIGPFRRLAVLAAALLNRFPEAWLRNAVTWFLSNADLHLSPFQSLYRYNSIPLDSKGKGANLAINANGSHHANIRTTMKLLNPQAVERSLFMADDELKVVAALDEDEIRSCVDR